MRWSPGCGCCGGCKDNYTSRDDHFDDGSVWECYFFVRHPHFQFQIYRGLIYAPIATSGTTVRAKDRAEFSENGSALEYRGSVVSSEGWDDFGIGMRESGFPQTLDVKTKIDEINSAFLLNLAGVNFTLFQNGRVITYAGTTVIHDFNDGIDPVDVLEIHARVVLVSSTMARAYLWKDGTLTGAFGTDFSHSVGTKPDGSGGYFGNIAFPFDQGILAKVDFLNFTSTPGI